ncbi:radical SAM protein [Desulfobacula sp.]|uniref:radical SAM protein n=1 Tax=Desulfobacula sp. TaxID=2593537 RepID=UPI0026332A7D|nr:radical SAM protein [Desulfobacula sp.]
MKTHTVKLILGLVKKGIFSRYMKFLGKASLPQAISLEITQNCIARCMMCNIWKTNPRTADLSAPKWLELLSSTFFADLRELDITGGEPYFKEDLTDILLGICRLKKTYLKRLQSVAVTTNGLLTEDVLTITETILPPFKRAGLDLVVVCAMDAVGKVHDRIRNYKNAWEKVNSTLEGLIHLRKKYTNLIVGLKTTVLPLNIKELNSIVQYADDRELFTIISPCIITKGRYLNPEKKKQLEFNPDQKKELARFYQGHHFNWSLHANALSEFFKTGRMKKPCTCGFNYFFIRSTGEMHLCPLIDNSVGNITTSDAADLYFSKPAIHGRKEIGRMEQCLTCTEPGLERYALPHEGFHYLRHMLIRGFKNFSALHRNMGLDKFDG